MGLTIDINFIDVDEPKRDEKGRFASVAKFVSHELKSGRYHQLHVEHIAGGTHAIRHPDHPNVAIGGKHFSSRVEAEHHLYKEADRGRKMWERTG